jgi:outer membrane protein TolC
MKMISRLRLLGVLFVFLLAGDLYSQSLSDLTLSECYILVRKNAPQLKQLSLNQQATEIEQEKLSTTNLPSLSAFGKASYQSDALAASFPMGDPFAIDLFQYNIGLEVDQKLFDGGMVGVQKELKRIEGDIQNLETEVGLYKLNELVNKYFFGIANLLKSSDILSLKFDVLNERKSNLESGVRNGLVLLSDLNRIDAEIATTKQQLTEVEMGIEKMKESLKIILGLKSRSFNLIIPELIVVNDSINRAELDLFSANRTYIESASKLQRKRYIPKMYAYGQTGYSYPGLNMFENKSDYYYIVGVKMAWQLFDWNQSKKEVQLLNLRKSKVDILESDFERNIETATSIQYIEIESLNKLIENDNEIVSSREKITEASASALRNGTITSVEYLSDLNTELQARFNLEIHKIKLLETQANLAVAYGIDLK